MASSRTQVTSGMGNRSREQISGTYLRLYGIGRPWGPARDNCHQIAIEPRALESRQERVVTRACRPVVLDFRPPTYSHLFQPQEMHIRHPSW